MTRTYLEAIVILIIAAAFAFFLTWPKYGGLQEAIGKIETKQAEIKNRQDYFAGLEKTSQDLARYEASLKKVETALPEGADAPALMNFIQSAAIQSGLILKHIDYEKAEKSGAETLPPAANANLKAGPRTYEIALTLTGTYPNLKNFLSRVELSSRMVEVSDLDFSYDIKNTDAQNLANLSPKNEEPVFDFKIKLSAQYY